MTDVFLSYATEDRPAARTIAEVLTRAGLDVAWDFEQYGGDDAVEATERALDAAACVVALWSAAAGQAGWVEPEATAGQRESRLVVARLDDAKLPRRLRRAPSVDLRGWDATRSAPELDSLRARVAEVADAAPPPPVAPVRAPPAARAAGPLDLQALLAATPRALSGHEGEVYDLDWSGDGRLVASASADRTAAVWRASDGSRIARLVGHRGEVNDVALAPAGDAAATAADDGAVAVWSVPAGALERRVELGGGAVYGVAFAPDGSRLAAVTEGGVIALLGANGREQWRVAHDAGLAAVRFFPDGTVLATGDDAGRVVLWDAGAGEPLLTIDAHDDDVTTLAVAPVGQLIASSSERGGLAVWQVPEKTMQWWQSEPAGMVYGCAFAPGGDVLAASDDEGITFWQVSDGEPLGQLEDPGSTRLEFSPPGTALAWASGTVVRLLG